MGGGEADIPLVSEAERAERVMDERFLNDIVRFSFRAGKGKSVVIATWSEIWRLVLERRGSVRSVEQTTSTMQPRVWGS